MMQRWSKRVTEVLRANLRRGTLLLMGTLIAIMMVMTPLMTRPAQAQLAGLQALGGSFTNGLSSCAIETVGWVICPTMRSIAKLADYGFSYMNQNFLRIDYALASNDSGTYTAWEIMRTIANAAFVIAFMVLVYSQLTGKNSGGYSIKRLLPRLIIAAIAVNLSYFLCVILIDISNIVGDSLINILRGIAERTGTTIMPIGKTGSAFNDGILTVITSAVMQKPGIAWVLLAPVAAVIVSIATISAVMLVVLIMRKTIVAMLILVSPLLFVAYLLPNLERFFTQGVRLFLQLLMLYPIIALLLGAGQIVSATIISVGVSDPNFRNYRVANDGYSSALGGSGSAITDLTAAAAAVLPLLGVWFLFKNMSTVMSSAGSRLTAAVKGRRGGGDDKEARVTGKATAGAQNIKRMFGGETPNRRQAYSHSRRRRSPGNSALSGGGSGQPSRVLPQDAILDGQQYSAAGVSEGQRALPQNPLGEKQPQDDKTDAEKQQEQENARLNTDAQDVNLDGINATGGKNEDSKNGKKSVTDAADDSVSAKDLFSQMNRKKGHESKDSERKFSAGAPAAGSGSSGGGGSSSSPSAPTVGFKAPQIAQNENIVTGTSTPVQATTAVAIPVQIDASSLLGQQHPPDNMTQPPISGTEEKAKARAQKYLFDTEKDLDEAREKQDILNKKDPDEPNELLQISDADNTIEKSSNKDDK